MELLDRLISDNPVLHNWPDGSPANWSVPAPVLRFIHGCLSPGMRTIETGAGQTTVVFAIAGTRHTCVSPQPEHTSKVRAYCAGLGITGDVTFIHESSDTALAREGVVPDTLDFVFIDGAHRFPFPCLDWHYTARRLKIGGIMGVDDCAMPSVKILHDFLCGEDEWELATLLGRTSFFRKIGEADITLDCQGQKINKLLK